MWSGHRTGLSLQRSDGAVEGLELELQEGQQISERSTCMEESVGMAVDDWSGNRIAMLKRGFQSNKTDLWCSSHMWLSQRCLGSL
jgi:hypothetical protein